MRSAVRDCFRQTTDEAVVRTLADSHRVFTRPDIEEGVRAFFDKRPPVFTARRGPMRPTPAEEP